VPSFSDGDARSYLPLLAIGARLYGREDMRYVATQGLEGTPPARRSAQFRASGYQVLRSGWDAPPHFTDAQHLVFDCGPLGEGNHGHFDALSFELAAHGRALVVDPGRYTYSEAGDINWRVRFRGTAMHNTVCVDGLTQTRYEPKPIKEPSRHAQGAVRHKIAGPGPDTTLLERAGGTVLDLLHGRCASHAYDAVHQRCIVFVDRSYWIVSDWLRAGSEHDYALNFQLGDHSEGATTLRTDADGTLLRSPGLLLAQPARAGQQAALVPGWVAPRYGHKLAAPALRTQARGHDVDFDSVLLPWRDGAAPTLQVEHLAVQGEGEVQAHALRIQITRPGEARRDGWFHARGAVARRWRIGPYEFSGRWLHWREDAGGRVQRAVSHAGATLFGPQGPVRLQTGGAA
jgi:Heparinase II/III-like protein